jgi:hypothetical protein
MEDELHPRVVVMRAGQVLAEHPLPPRGELVLGRNEGCQVTITDNSVSRMHARLFADESGVVYLEDLGSANGTFVDNQRIAARVRLHDGQLVRAAQKNLTNPTVVRFEDPAARLIEDLPGLPSFEPVRTPTRPDGLAASPEPTRPEGDGPPAPPLPSRPASAPAPPPPIEPPRPSRGPVAVTPLLIPTPPPTQRRPVSPVLLLAGVTAVLLLMAGAAVVGWMVLKPLLARRTADGGQPPAAPATTLVAPAPAAPALPEPLREAEPAGATSPALPASPAAAPAEPPPQPLPTAAAAPPLPAALEPQPPAAAPASTGATTATGAWKARLQNVFYPGDDYVVEIDLDLQQRGTSVTGSGRGVVESKAMTFRVPSAAADGRLRAGTPPRLDLHLPMGRPIGDLHLEGTIEGDAIAGTFRSSLAKGEGTWQAVRQR